MSAGGSLPWSLAIGSTPLGVSPGGVLCVCLDLNVLMGAIFSRMRGNGDGMMSTVLRNVEESRGPTGPMQLIISASMLSHLTSNLERELVARARKKGVEPDLTRIREIIEPFRDEIELLAENGPLTTGLVVFFGGDTAAPSNDTDLEDAHVLSTALHGGAHVLVSNDGHFVDPKRPLKPAHPVPGHAGAFLYDDGPYRLFITTAHTFLVWSRTAQQSLPHVHPAPARTQVSQRALFPEPLPSPLHPPAPPMSQHEAQRDEQAMSDV